MTEKYEKTMSRFSKDRKYRLRDFKRRSAYNPKNVYTHRQLGHEYIPIHPFSDETELLKRLKMTPERCLSVDAYWNMENDVCFLQVEVNVSNPGIFARWSKEQKRYLNFHVHVTETALSRTIFEDVMTQIWEKGYRPSHTLRKRLRETLILLQRNI